MFDRDTHAFYKEFKDNNGTDLRLEFYPAPSAPLAAVRTFVEFGDYMITSDVGGLKANFNDSIPCGRELAKSMKIKVDFAEFKGDFDLVRKWIFWGQSQTEYTPTDSRFSYFKTPFRLPNLWVLKKFKNGSWITQFIGSQTPTTEKTFKKSTKNNTIMFEFECIEFWKYICENVILSEVAGGAEQEVKRYIDLEFYDTNPWMTVFYRSLSTAATDHKYYFVRVNRIFEYIGTYFSDICLWFYFYEYPTPFTCTDKITSHWDFYKQKDSTRTCDRELITAEPKVLGLIVKPTDANPIKGGLFSEKDENSIQKTLKTAWDYIGRLADMFACKITFDYEIGKIKINPIFSHHLPKLTIDSNSIVKEDEIEIKSDYQMAGKAIAHLPADLEYTWDRFGTLADTTEEIEFIFTTAPAPVLERTTTVSGIPINGISCHRIDECRLASPSYDGLYYPRKWNGDESATDYEMMRVHPLCEVYLDTERTISSNMHTYPNYELPSYLDADENEVDDLFVVESKLWRDRQMTVSFGANTVWANLAATSNFNQCLIPCKIEGVELRDLGRQVELDLSLFGLDGFFTSKTVRCFLTGIEFEKVTDTIAKCEIFVSAI